MNGIIDQCEDTISEMEEKMVNYDESLTEAKKKIKNILQLLDDTD